MKSPRWLLVAPVLLLLCSIVRAQIDLSNVNLGSDPRFNKMLVAQPETTRTATDRPPKPTVAAVPEAMNNTNPTIAFVPISPLASDPRFNKMLNTDNSKPKIPMANDPK